MAEIVYGNVAEKLFRYAAWIALAAFVGVALATFFATGFAQGTLTHEVFHDLRHAAGLPCH